MRLRRDEAAEQEISKEQGRDEYGLTVTVAFARPVPIACSLSLTVAVPPARRRW
ncbi:hypothetical protein [Mesorhizobium sp. B4-1-3]|uniref:hypothetical protein n=1 Tax=Mesorhizobium sp. B4-1-3 TaxID=2589889 RepID=UPI0015E36506|nr:hypothetical protein [Mesorhizobium sp. B4-1-3]